MEVKLKTNRAAGIGSCLFAALIWWLIPEQIQSLSDGTVSAGFLPQLVVAVMFIGGIVLIIQSILGKESTVQIDLGEIGKELIYAGMIAAYVFAFGKIGFMVSSILLGVLSLVLLKNRRWTHYMAVIIIPVVLQYFFSRLLQVPLP